MKTWKGKIEKKFERDFQGTMLYSFRLEGVDRWFRTGKEQVEQPEGATIQFDERNNQVQVESIAPCAEVSSSTEPPSGQTGQTRSSSEATAPTVGERMALEAARRDATQIIVAALHTDALPWAKNTAKSKKLDLLVEYVHQVARQLMEEPK